MKKQIFSYFFILACSIFNAACSGKNAPDSQDLVAVFKLVSVVPENNSTVVPGDVVVAFDFSENVRLVDKLKIQVNNLATDRVAAVGKQVKVLVPATGGTTYEVKLKAGAISDARGALSHEDYTVKFLCQNSTLNRSVEAQNVLDYIKRIQGKSCISGTIANVNQNTNEANWVYSKAYKYPAFNCIDFLHAYASKAGGWINYEDTKVMEQWWNSKGLIGAMWHWNVPATKAGEYTAYSDSTTFDATRIFVDGSDEQQMAMKDLEKIAGYLQLYKQKNIPVFWRPLHEAGGRWFWWGKKDAATFKKLWILMYDYFTQKGLNNLIWVWSPAIAWNETMEACLDWYPGDDYVDMVGYDIYEKSAAECNDIYQFFVKHYPNKPAALTECGSVPTIGEQWKAGAKWTMFMVWYDYKRTNDVASEAFKSDEHKHANAAWWRTSMQDEMVLDRDEIPSFK